jgi:hypothetical protein
MRKNRESVINITADKVQWHIAGSLKRNEHRGKFEIKEIAIYEANETKYIKIILCCFKHEIYFSGD